MEAEVVVEVRASADPSAGDSVLDVFCLFPGQSISTFHSELR